MKKTLKDNLSSFLAFVALTSFILGIHTLAFPMQNLQAASEEPGQILEEIIGKSGLQKGERIHQLASVDPGADIITSTIFKALDFLKYLLGGIAVLYVIISGVKLITATTTIDEESQKQKENLKYIIYGLILVIIADELVTKVFFGDYGECLASASNARECAKLGGGLIKGLYSFILSIMASIAIFVIVVSAFRMITSYGNEEDITKQKKRMLISLVGLLIAGVGEFAIKGVVFPEAGTRGIDVIAAQKLVLNFTNFIAAFIGTAAFVILFYGGYLYVISAGNEEKTGKAKKIMLSAVIGIVIALAAFGVITTVTSLGPSREITLPKTIPGLPVGTK